MDQRHPQHDEADRLARWVREHSRAVRGYLLSATGRADLADELTQEVFYKALRGQDRYVEQGTARSYLVKIADRLVCDRHRRLGREVTIDADAWERIEPVDEASEPPSVIEQAESAEQLTEALESLSADQRRVLLLRYYGDLSFRDIAQTIDCPVSTALSHCRRGLQTLRKLLVEKSERSP